jgi:predicted RNA-binding Zn-ribbon protein involved in translation (DUF1610 family)
MYCKRCGTELPEDVFHCANCGNETVQSSITAGNSKKYYGGRW